MAQEDLIVEETNFVIVLFCLCFGLQERDA